MYVCIYKLQLCIYFYTYICMYILAAALYIFVYIYMYVCISCSTDIQLVRNSLLLHNTSTWIVNVLSTMLPFKLLYNSNNDLSVTFSIIFNLVIFCIIKMAYFMLHVTFSITSYFGIIFVFSKK